MKCNEFKEKVVDLFDKTIDIQTQAQLSEHMKSCHECKAYYDELRETFDMLQTKETVLPAKSKNTHQSWRIAAIFIAAAFLCGMSFAAYHAVSPKHNVKQIKPKNITEMPKMTKAEFQNYLELRDAGKEPKDMSKYGDLTVYEDLYGWSCSWYCGGNVKNVTATSCLNPIKKFNYKAKNAHDFDHESVWATKGKGIGESLTYTFEGKCPRITTVKILNGHVKSEAIWKANSRVKKLRMYFNGKPYAILALQDSRTLQCFDVGRLGYNNVSSLDWTLKFEILEVYPGLKHDDTVIAELYFDGIDVH